MSEWGILIDNDAGKLAISSDRIVPRFVGKAPFESQSGTLLVYALSGLVPGDRYLGAYTLPPANGSSCWFGQFASQSVVADASGVIRINIRAFGFTGVAYPEVYVFGLSRPPSAGSGWGFAISDAAGNVTYSAEHYPLMISAMPDIALSGAGVSIPAGVSKPAFFPPSYTRIVNDGSPFPLPMGFHSTNGYFGGYRTLGGAVYAAQVNYFSSSGPGAGTPSTFEYGTTAAQPLPIINAASYD